MAWRDVSSSVSSDLGSWLYSAPFEAAVTRTPSNRYSRANPALRGRFDQTFFVETLR